MAVVLGTNAGFVTVAPTADPAGTTTIIDTQAMAVKDTTPVGYGKITEVGWWCDNVTEETNFEVGLYSHNSGSNKPATRLNVATTNAKGTPAGWKTVTVDWDIVAGTVYWIALQVDDTATQTNIDRNADATRISIKTGSTTLIDPWSATSTETIWARALYALVSTTTTIDIEATVAGTGAISGTLTLNTQVSLESIIASVSTISGTLILSSNWQTDNFKTIKRLVAIGNGSFYYEDI